MSKGKGGNEEKRKRFNNKYPREDSDRGGKRIKHRYSSPMAKYLSINGQYINPSDRKSGKKDIFKIKNTGLWRNAKVHEWQRCGGCSDEKSDLGCKKCDNIGYINLVKYQNDNRNRKKTEVSKA